MLLDLILLSGGAIAAVFIFKLVDNAASKLARKLWGDLEDDPEMRIW